MTSDTKAAGSGFERLVGIMARLRAPDGCPWDRAQTHASLKSYLLEEAYEALAALDESDADKLCDELGDLLFEVPAYVLFELFGIPRSELGNVRKFAQRLAVLG